MSFAMTSRRFLALMVGMAAIVGANTAMAATIDFTNASAWGAASGSSSYTTTVGGVGVTAQAQPAGEGATLFQSGNGLGVNYQDSSSGAAAQIDSGELLQLSFDQAVQVTSFSVDLFSTSVSGSFWRLNVYEDQGRVHYTDVNGVTQIAGSFSSGLDFFSAGSTSFGLNLPAITGIDFSAYGAYSDYSLRSVTFSDLGASTVPELDPSGAGAVLCLLLGGVAVVMGRRQAIV